jgi:hypothetical protein
VTTTGLRPVPSWDGSSVVIEPPVSRPGAWAGGPSAVLDDDGTVWLAYRLRLPIGLGRGYANVLARSSDGLEFTPVAEIHRDSFGGESLERPALVRTSDGRWRLYISVATPGTKHWRVDLLEADRPEDLASATPRTVLPGDDMTAVKDPVLLEDGGRWHLWASVHPLDDPDATDRMMVDYATSPDGVDWEWHGTVLRGRDREWDARGVRPADVAVVGDGLVMTYDGRATAEENWEERTGVARASRDSDGRFGTFVADDGPPVESPHPGHGLRYVSLLPLPDGSLRIYYEATRADGAHELRTELL